MQWFLGLPRGSHRSVTTCALSIATSMSYKAIYRWLLIVLDLEVPGKGQAAN